LLLAPALGAAQQNGAQPDGSPPAPVQTALDALAACTEALGDEAAGDFVLEDVCPELEDALSDSGYAPFVSFAQRQELTADSLSDLQALIARYERKHADARPLDLQGLTAILDSLEDVQQREPPLSWWEKLKRWLRGRLGAGAGADSWLARWLDRFELNPSVSQVIVVTCIVLVILLALIVLLNELRVAGVFRRRGARERRSQAATVSGERTLSWGDFERIAPADRPSFVLRMLVAALVRSGRLRTERSLTHREISVRAALEDDAQRVCLARVAGLAEKVVYGGAMPDADADAVIAQGRELHARLSAGAS
jgi:hypothetical protein